MQFPPGYRLGPYEVTGHLGTGGMGAVLRAVDTRLHREVAVKVLQTSQKMPGLRERFLREARAASSLNHPNICTVFDIGEQDGEPYMVMELLHGETLKDHLERGPLPTEMVVSIAREVSDALAAAHANGIVHRDIKPANIHLCPKANGPYQVKVLDFGLAKIEWASRDQSRLSTGLTTMGATVGTVAYMSPEQARGEDLDARSDLFSFGAVLYEMVTGTVPFNGATSAVVFVELLSKDPVPIRDWNARVPRELESIINRLLEKDRNHRFQSATELLKAFDRAASRPVVAAVPERPRPLVPEPLEPVARERRSAARPQPPVSRTVPPRASSPSRPSVQMQAVTDPLPSAEIEYMRSGVSSVHRVRVEEEQVDARPAGTARRKSPYIIVAGMALLLCGVAYLVWSHAHGKRSGIVLGANDSIQVATIENHTGDGTLDGASTALEIMLSQSPTLNVQDESGFRVAVGADPHANAVDAATARSTAQALGSSVYVHGNIDSTGPQQYSLSIEARRTGDNQLIAKEDEQAISSQGLPTALEHAAQRLRADLGESEESIGANSVPLSSAASVSLQALQSLRDARTSRAARDSVTSAVAYARAIKQDPAFDLARLELASLQHELGAEAEAEKNFSDAHSLTTRGTLAERMEMRTLGNLLHGAPSAAADSARQWTNATPAASRAFSYLAQALRVAGRYADAAQAASTAMELNPSDTVALAEAERDMLALNRFESIIQIEERSRRIGVQHPGIALLAGHALGRIQNDAEQNAYAGLIENIRDRVRFAGYLDNIGQLSVGGDAWDRASSAMANEPSAASGSFALMQNAALNRALAGDCDAAQSFLSRPAEVAMMNAGSISDRGIAFALCGDAANARAMADALRTRFPHQPVAETYLLPNLEAAIQLTSGAPAQALTSLGNARGPSVLTMTAYLRALARIALRQYDTAIADLQTVLANRGISLLSNSVLYPVAQRKLAETYASMGDKQNAANAYDAFVKTWSHADHGIAPRK